MGNDRASLEGAALRFACVGPYDSGITRERTFDALSEAVAACADGERLLVLDGSGAVQNLDPYRPPEPVTAAGGLIVRDPGSASGAGGEEPELLLIFRRGAWDLPKGKLDPGESVGECAVREVREEVGIDDLTVLGPAGTTLHGYPEGDRYMVKTTHWFFMRTPERDFTPEEREGIEEVRWVPWAEAEAMLGYDTLRDLVARLGAEERKSGGAEGSR